MLKEIGENTKKHLESLKKRATEIMRVMGVSEPVAWQMMNACDIQKVLEVADKIDRRQELVAAAEKRAKAAYAATFKTNVENDNP